MATNKEIRLEIAKESLASAQKMLSQLPDGAVPASEMSRIHDAATQATQAAAQLNQLVGLLLSDIER